MRTPSNPTGKGGFKERPQDVNRGGRPHRSWTWAGLLAEAVEEELTAKDGSKGKAKAFITKRLVRLAIEGDMIAQKEIMNRMDGMPKQSVELSGDSDNPVQVEVNSTLNKIYGQTDATSTDKVHTDGS